VLPHEPSQDIQYQKSVKYPKAGKLLCLVLTYPGTHNTKAMAVEKTWGPGYVCSYDLFSMSYQTCHYYSLCSFLRSCGVRLIALADYIHLIFTNRCDLTLFVTSQHHPDLNTLAFKLSAPESRFIIWEKTK
jgi:hypothetical protein